MSTKRTQKSYDSEFKAQAVKLAQEIAGHKAAKELDKENRRLREENEFLEEASAFFAASRRRSAKNRD